MQAFWAGSVVVLRIGIRAGGQEGANYLAISVAHVEQRPPQRGVTEPVASVQVRPSFDQYDGYVRVLGVGSEVQRSEPLPVGGIHLIAVLLQVGNHVFGPAFEGGVEQRRPSCAVRPGGHVRDLCLPASRGALRPPGRALEDFQRRRPDCARADDPISHIWPTSRGAPPLAATGRPLHWRPAAGGHSQRTQQRPYRTPHSTRLEPRCQSVPTSANPAALSALVWAASWAPSLL